MSSFVAVSPARPDALRRGQNDYIGLDKNRSTPTGAIDKLVSELAIRIEGSVAPARSSERDTSVREQNTTKSVEKEVVVLNMTLDTPTRSNVVLGKRGCETDRFGNSLGSNG